MLREQLLPLLFFDLLFDVADPLLVFEHLLVADLVGWDLPQLWIPTEVLLVEVLIKPPLLVFVDFGDSG